MTGVERELALTADTMGNTVRPAYAELNGIIRAIQAEELDDEPTDVFSTTPFEFEESAKILWEDTRLTYYHACKANRYSENYLKLCGLLEKNIRQAGSLCMTKAVLERSGLSFPDLDDMSIPEMLGMVSYHLRKCHAAFQEIYLNNNFLGMSYLNCEFRWVNLGSRLKATEAKIQNIRDGKINVSRMLEQVQSIQNISHADNVKKNGIPTGLRTNPNALPMNGSLAREMLRIKDHAAKIQKEQRKELESAFSIWGTSDLGMLDGILYGLDPSTHQPLQDAAPARESQSYEEPETDPEYITEDEIRKTLIDHAAETGDREAQNSIPQEDSKTLHERWTAYLQKLAAQPEFISTRNPVQFSNHSPTNYTRKKLRSKHRKRKKT